MRFLYLSLIFLLLCGCNEATKENKYVSSIVANEENEKELEENLSDVQTEEKQRMSNLTSISFDRMMHDFGTVKADADYSTVFTIYNTGKKPLRIFDVKASCGCTVPTWNKNPIPPNGSDKIKVTFHPKTTQLGTQNKTISVLSNSDPGIAILEIHSNIVPQ
jgi:hypothetical protein